MHITPAPVHVELGDGELVWPEHAVIEVCQDLVCLAEFLRAELKKRTHLDASVSTSNTDPTVILCFGNVPEAIGSPSPCEAYTLTVSERKRVCIAGEGAAGVFYGIQSLLQLLPWVDRPNKEASVRIRCCRLVDFPRFEWRGTLLDTGRHLFSITFIKKLLDLLALHKLNKFHWHLTEDQGWRIEIKAFPLLTEVGAYRGSGEFRYGGYYTQEEIREVVKYARERFIEVIPEIELPGHCMAALACYPKLSCTEEQHHVPTQWGVQTDVYCAGKESTFEFLEKVLDEVVQLFPSRFIHIGGDECPKTRWSSCKACQLRIKEESLKGEEQLQTYFINRIARHLRKQGRSIIGWDEILEGGIPEGAVVMCWRGTMGGIAAAKHKHRVIMTPNTRCYFDYRQSVSLQEPGTWYAVLPLEWVYMFDPCCAQGQLDTRLCETATETATVIPTTKETSKTKSSDNSGGGHSNPSSLSDTDAVPVETFPATVHPQPSEDAMECGEDAAQDSANGEEGPDFSCMRGLAVPGFDESAAQLAQHAEKAPVATPDSSTETAGEAECQQAALAQMHCSMDAVDQQYVMGGQANLWTEFISDEITAEYMLLPRLCALSECVWSPVRTRNWRSFLERTRTLLAKLSVAGYNYRPLVFPVQPVTMPADL